MEGALTTTTLLAVVVGGVGDGSALNICANALASSVSILMDIDADEMAAPRVVGGDGAVTTLADGGEGDESILRSCASAFTSPPVSILPDIDDPAAVSSDDDAATVVVVAVVVVVVVDDEATLSTSPSSQGIESGHPQTP